MGSKKRRNRKIDDEETRDARFKALEEYLSQEFETDGADVIESKYLKITRLSKAIIDISQPFYDDARNFEEKRRVLEIAVSAWNALGSQRYLAQWCEDLETRGPEDYLEASEVFLEMTKKKIRHYYDDRRKVTNFSCEIVEDRIDFRVESRSFPEGEDELE